MTYSGRYRGKARNVRPSPLRIEFPDAPSGVTMPSQEKEVSIKNGTAEEEC